MYLSYSFLSNIKRLIVFYVFNFNKVTLCSKYMNIFLERNNIDCNYLMIQL